MVDNSSAYRNTWVSFYLQVLWIDHLIRHDAVDENTEAESCHYDAADFALMFGEMQPSRQQRSHILEKHTYYSHKILTASPTPKPPITP